MADGTLWGFSAEALALPTGLIIAAYLARRLGPEGYGLLVLATTVAGWLAWTTASLCSARAVIKLVSEAQDWRPVGTLVLRVHLALGLGAGALLYLAAEPLAHLLGQPEVAFYIALLTLEVVLLNAAQAHRKVLIGLGRFRRPAAGSAARWVARLVAIVVLVEMGLSVTGAVLGGIVAVAVEFAVYRASLRLPLSGRAGFPLGRLVGYAAPLFLFALCLQVATKIDLVALAVLGASAAQVGIYGAAQSLSMVPGILAAALSPLLLASLGQLLKAGDEAAARRLARDALRFTVGLLPFAAMTVGAADEVVGWIFGPAFAPAGPLLAILIFAAVATIAIMVATVVPVAAERPGWTLAIAAPVLVLSIAGQVVVIPLYGALGAATVTAAVTGLGAVAAAAVAFRLWRVAPGARTTARSLAIGALALVAAAWWPTPGALVLVKIVVISSAIPLAFWLLGELDAADTRLLRSLAPSRRAS
jgi:O-antigen/teichoic acid export membrane protein